MCGIVGIYNFKPDSRVDESLLRKMTDVLKHRGPDHSGYYVDSYLGLGHRRLSIIDLSKNGKQPMCNENKDVWITYNGEVYNFRQLREDLEKKGHRFMSNTDTEVIIHAYEEYGEECVKLFRGMFAFAIWDNRNRKNKKLFLARDRVGKKPLFYYYDKDRLIFASELKSVLGDKTIKREIDLESLSLYLTYGYVPAPKSIFKNIHKIMPGNYLVCENGKIRTKQYWDLEYKKTDYSEEYYKKAILKELEEAVKIRLISDVPLGAFLSGGIDSSAVVAMMAKFSEKPVRTFTIGFEEKELDETEYARIIAEKFGTDHKERIVKPEVIKILPDLVWYYNEPYSDSSALPSYYAAKMAKEHVTVALNGDGGDESFAGYERYLRDKLFNGYDAVPAYLRRLISFSIKSLPPPKTHYSLCRKIKRFDVLSNMHRDDRFINSMMICDDQLKKSLINERFERLNIDSSAIIKSELKKNNAHNFLNKMMYSDIKRYLPDDLLVKMDIATMANSIEARSPFLDHKMMELAASIPPSLKLKGFTKKYILKKALAGILPRKILHRKKMGFGVPMSIWFRKDLRNFAYDALLGKETFISDYMKKDGVKNVLDLHSSGRKDNSAAIWNLLWLETWGRVYMQNRKLKNVY